jgi:predicted permease
MLRNYLKIAWRNLVKNKLHSGINVVGLAVGMACCGVLALFVLDELGHDQFHQKRERLHWVWNRTNDNGTMQAYNNTPNVMAETLLKTIPEVKNAARADHGGDYTVRTGEKVLRAQGRLVDPAFLTMFTFPLIKGSAEMAFSSPNTILLTESMATRLFGSTAVLGRTILLDNQETMTVTGVLQDVPINSRLQFDILMPWSYYEKRQPWVREKTWGSNAFLTFIELQPDASFEQVDAKVNRIFDQYSHEKGYRNEYFLHPLTKWHLYNEFKNGYAAGGNIDFIRLFAWMALGILLIACINFMNLSTARSLQRAKEVGIRKVVGARRSGLAGQFLMESVLMTSLAFGLACLLSYFILPAFNTLTDEQLRFEYSNPRFWSVAGAVTLLTGLIAGSYPALYLSNFRPVVVLKGLFSTSRTGRRARQGMVVTQFALSAGLIVATALIYQQLQFIKNRPSGYDRNQLVYAWLEGNLEKNFQLIRREAMQTGLIENATLSQHAITNDYHSSQNISWKGKPVNQPVDFDIVGADYEFVKTHKIQLTQGRDFSSAFGTDSTAVLLNEAAVKTMGLKNPIGETIQFWGEPRQVVGVFKDFIWGEVFGRVPPMIVVTQRLPNYAMTLRLSSNKSTSEALAALLQVFKKYNPNFPTTDFHFIDKAYADKYRAETIVGKLSASFAVLAIFVACLGLFGLASFTAEQRTKEIGIRKVLGATLTSIWFTLSRDFLKLALLALLIGSPIAWYLMQSWLQKYDVRAEVNWWIFPLTGGLLLAIALLTVSFQAIKAALMNPVKSLRTE